MPTREDRDIKMHKVYEVKPLNLSKSQVDGHQYNALGEKDYWEQKQSIIVTGIASPRRQKFNRSSKKYVIL